MDREDGLPDLAHRKAMTISCLTPIPQRPYLQVHAGILHDQHGQGRDVNAGIALSGQEKLIVLVLREEAEKILQGLKIALGDLGKAGWKEPKASGIGATNRKDFRDHDTHHPL